LVFMCFLIGDDIAMTHDHIYIYIDIHLMKCKAGA
jgi:hypothetical protein